jgi:hypothetical protein
MTAAVRFSKLSELDRFGASQLDARNASSIQDLA